jgi:hypothetical protein
MKKISSIVEKIEGTDWENFSGSPQYKPEDVQSALLRLVQLKKADASENIGHFVLSAIGNDHAGTYYPVIVAALELIIEIEEQDENHVAKQCALGVLYDLTCFKADLEGYDKVSKEELEGWVSEKLAPYGYET